MKASKPYIGFGCFFHGKGKERYMRIQDMVLVIENTKGSEKNMLMTVKEYKEAYLFVSSLSREESAQALKELFDTKFSEPGNGWA